jgi:hypothetical protein
MAVASAGGSLVAVVGSTGWMGIRRLGGAVVSTDTSRQDCEGWVVGTLRLLQRGAEPAGASTSETAQADWEKKQIAPMLAVRGKESGGKKRKGIRGLAHRWAECNRNHKDRGRNQQRS